MTRIEALKRIAEKVEAGEWSNRKTLAMDAGFDLDAIVYAVRAYSGSLDAAKALHEAVLPGWDYIVARTNGGLITLAQVGPDVEEFDQDPARAWLLAILRALIAQEEEEKLDD